MSPAYKIFERFVNGDIKEIENLKSNNESESLYLDFKLFRGDNWKNTYSKAASAFANSEGGVLVWGVDCRQKDGIDIVQDVIPIRNITKVKSNLDNYTSCATAPGIVGSENFVITAADDTGYIVSYIPKHDGMPIMAMGNDQHNFYYRASSSSLPMEQYMLADRFSRRPQPKLCLVFDVNISENYPGEKTEISIRVNLHNLGKGIALYSAAYISADAYIRDHWSSNALHYAGGNIYDNEIICGYTYEANPNYVIYPNEKRGLAQIRFEISDSVENRLKLNTINQLRGTDYTKVDTSDTPIPKDFTFKYSLYADGFVGEGQKVITLNEIMSVKQLQLKCDNYE
jgi:hypothetical protein